jgi:Sec-independent protein translocase protein TatA
MNFFGIGGAEIVLIILIMLVVAGPKRMIQWAYVMGVWAGKARNMWSQAVATLQQEIDAAGGGITLPKEPPTRQSLARMVNEAVKPYAQEIEQTYKETDALVKGANVKPATAAKLPAQTLKAAQTPKTAETPAPKASEPNLGTWGNPAPTNNGANLGTWSAPKEDS